MSLHLTLFCKTQHNTLGEKNQDKITESWAILVCLVSYCLFINIPDIKFIEVEGWSGCV
jgi:hypothetical protein